MLPIIELGTISISAYWLFLLIAILVSAMLAFHRLLQSGYPPNLVTNCLLFTIIGGFLGAYILRGLVFLLQTFFLEGLLYWPGGSSSLGAVIGGIAAAVFYFKRNDIYLARVLDVEIVTLPLGQSIGRLGCLAAGCCYGKPTDSIFGLLMPGLQGHWEYRYPTQIIYSLADLLIFFTLLAFERYWARRGQADTWPFSGFIFLLYVMLFTALRFGMEFLRGDNPTLSGPFTIGHVIAGAAFLLAAGAMAWNLNHKADLRRN